MARWILLLAIFAPLQFVLADDPVLRAKVQSFYDGVKQVWNTGDYRTIASHFTDDAALLLQGTPAVQGIENITSFFKQTINFSSIVALTAIDVEYLHHDSEGNGQIFVRGNVTTTPAGKTEQSSSSVVHVLIFFDGDMYVALEGINSYPGPHSDATRPGSLLSKQRAIDVTLDVPARRASSWPPNPVYDRIVAANQLWTTAFSSGNSTALAQLYTPDATVLAENTFPVVGRSAIATLFGSAMAAGVASVELIVGEVGVTPNDTYYFERSEYVFHNKAGGVVDVGKYLVIWRTQPTLQIYIDLFNSNGH
eukprot:m.228966 g.228966  ORF g.228966 m.228966 type:complete len:308 (-) comp17633_c0_seq1:140-1063(-)